MNNVVQCITGMTIGIAVAGYYETSDTVGIEINVPL